MINRICVVDKHTVVIYDNTTATSSTVCLECTGTWNMSVNVILKQIQSEQSMCGYTQYKTIGDTLFVTSK